MDLSQIRKVAVFRALQLGDLLCSIPAIRAVKMSLPNASITLIGLASQRSFANRFNQYFDDFIEFPGWPGLPEQPVDAQQILMFLKQIRQKKFDLVLQMQGNGQVTNNMCKLWEAQHIYGLSSTDASPEPKQFFPVSDDIDHEILRFLKIVDALGVPRQGTYLEFPFLDQDVEDFIQLNTHEILQPQRYVCLHPGARDEKRRWRLEKFARVGNALASKGYSIVLTGSEAERPILEHLEELLDFEVYSPIVQHGKLSLGALALIIKNAALLVSNDTGVSHIAAALEVPSVIIFSPYSDRRRWAPLNTILHRSIPPDIGNDPEKIIQIALDHLDVTVGREGSSLLFN